MSDVAVADAPVVAADPAPAADVVAAPAAPVQDSAPAAPVEIVYDLKTPENAALDAAASERTVAFARSRGLSNDAAQAALDLANTEVASAKEAIFKDHQPGGAAWTKQVDGWKAETLADASLGATPEARTAAIQKGVQIVNKYTEAHPEQAADFKGFFDTSGLGNHPAAVRFFAWLGEVASEGSLVTSQIGGDGRKADVDVFYSKTS